MKPIGFPIGFFMFEIPIMFASLDFLLYSLFFIVHLIPDITISLKIENCCLCFIG